MVIVGSDMLQRPDADAIYNAVVTIASSGGDWKTLNILHRVRPHNNIYIIHYNTACIYTGQHAIIGKLTTALVSIFMYIQEKTNLVLL